MKTGLVGVAREAVVTALGRLLLKGCISDGPLRTEAVLALPGGETATGTAAIRTFYQQLLADGRRSPQGISGRSCATATGR
jgi:hypothetical protein